MFSSLKSLVEIQMSQWAQALFGGASVPQIQQIGVGKSSGMQLVNALRNLQNGGTLNFSSSATTEAPNPAPEQYPPQDSPVDWQAEIAQDNMKDLTLASCRAAKSQALSQNDKSERLSRLLVMALNAGDISTAMMLFSALESSSANDVTRTLVQKVQTLQDNRRKLSEDLANQKNDADGSKNMQKIKTEMEQNSDDIAVLQTFIQEVAQNKQSSVEMANSFINKEHETTMAIVRSFGR